ncbi:MAG: cysteine protease StiP family protein [Solibacillus sp.]
MLKYEPDAMGSYNEQDVTFLLRDLSYIEMELSNEEREQKIQSGTAHYSEMLPIEYSPGEPYMKLYEDMLEQYAEKVAKCVALVSEKVVALRGADNLVLVSLARAGTPIGILMKRYIAFSYGVDVPHYSISIVRGRGIDEAALQYITDKHPDGAVQFVDGWTGKGAITKELTEAVEAWNKAGRKTLDAEMAVLADPGHCVTLYGTREDFLIPSACLNSTVSGLVSRTILNYAFLEQGDFHGAKYYKELIKVDVSNAYIEAIICHFSEQLVAEVKVELLHVAPEPEPTWEGLLSVARIEQQFAITNRHHIKPGVGETTRVLLRRVPWKILVNPAAEQNLTHIYLLAKERGVEIEPYADMTYSCCGLIKELK